MYSIENICKLHDMGFTSEQIEQITSLDVLQTNPQPEPQPDPQLEPQPDPQLEQHNQQPKPQTEPQPEPQPEPRVDQLMNYFGTQFSELTKHFDELTKQLQATMIRGSEQPAEKTTDEILASILSPSGEQL